MQKMQKDDHSVPYMTQLPSRQILVNLESIQKNPAFTWGYQFNSNHPYQKKKQWPDLTYLPGLSIYLCNCLLRVLPRTEARYKVHNYCCM